MRHGTSGRRQRNRNTGGNGGGHRNNQPRSQVFDSNGPDVRIRGTAHQVAEKYLALAKDATSSGDIVVAENYYQHAEHYIRLIGEQNGQFDAAKVLGHNSQDLSAQHDKGNRVKSQGKAERKPDKEDDLGLPGTILGPEVSVESKTPEETVE